MPKLFSLGGPGFMIEIISNEQIKEKEFPPKIKIPENYYL